MQTQEDHFKFLDELRESGVTNMFGAGPYLISKFQLTPNAAAEVLHRWMVTFSERHSMQSRYLP